MIPVVRTYTSPEAFIEAARQIHAGVRRAVEVDDIRKRCERLDRLVKRAAWLNARAQAEALMNRLQYGR